MIQPLSLSDIHQLMLVIKGYDILTFNNAFYDSSYTNGYQPRILLDSDIPCGDMGSLHMNLGNATIDIVVAPVNLAFICALQIPEAKIRTDDYYRDTSSLKFLWNHRRKFIVWTPDK